MSQRKEQGKKRNRGATRKIKREKQNRPQRQPRENSKGPRTNESLLQLSYHLHTIDIDYFRFDRDNTLLLGYGSG